MQSSPGRAGRRVDGTPRSHGGQRPPPTGPYRRSAAPGSLVVGEPGKVAVYLDDPVRDATIARLSSLLEQRAEVATIRFDSKAQACRVQEAVRRSGGPRRERRLRCAACELPGAAHARDLRLLVARRAHPRERGRRRYIPLRERSLHAPRFKRTRSDTSRGASAYRVHSLESPIGSTR